MSCRLPQTPRTPAVGLDHYFDEVIRRPSLSLTTSSKPHKLRRASTARSIGARSDFINDQSEASQPQSLVGLGIRADDRDNDEVEEEEEGLPSSFASPTTEVDPRLHSYVAEQLERYSALLGDEAGGIEQLEEEFEATP